MSSVPFATTHYQTRALFVFELPLMGTFFTFFKFLYISFLFLLFLSFFFLFVCLILNPVAYLTQSSQRMSQNEGPKDTWQGSRYILPFPFCSHLLSLVHFFAYLLYFYINSEECASCYCRLASDRCCCSFRTFTCRSSFSCRFVIFLYIFPSFCSPPFSSTSCFILCYFQITVDGKNKRESVPAIVSEILLETIASIGNETSTFLHYFLLWFPPLSLSLSTFPCLSSFHYFFPYSFASANCLFFFC
jgi:hypothetical protein